MKATMSDKQDQLKPSTQDMQQAASRGRNEETNGSPSSGFEVTFPILVLIYVGLDMALFMTLMESTIISTSVVAITNDLGGYVKSSWVFTSYLLTFSGFPILWAKASDIAGRKPCLLVAMAIFLIFSAVCGSAQTLMQLIMFRWLQGIGAAGIFSLILVFYELIPPSKYALSAGVTNMVISLSFLTGPLIGGAITKDGKWRWIFYINLPVIAISSIIIVLVFPRRLSREPVAHRDDEPLVQRLKRFDVLGGIMLLGVTVTLVTALQQASQGLPFSSSLVWPLLLVSGLFLIGFLTWQWYATTKREVPEPVLPWRFLVHRDSLSIMLNTFLSGAVMTVCTVQIPQRFMVLYGMSSLDAGIRLLPFSLMVPVGSGLAAFLLGRRILTLSILLLMGGILQTVGVTLYMALIPHTDTMAMQYGFQVVIGIGIGFVATATFLLIPIKMEARDLAVGTGMVTQFRILGGVLGLAIATCISTPLIRDMLLKTVSPEQAYAILERLDILPHLSRQTQEHVRRSFSDGFDLQLKFITGLAVAQIPASLLMIIRKEAVNDPR